MALARGRNRQDASAFYWPGFVDAMATLLLVIIFLLSIFMLTQFMLAREISGQGSVLNRLKSQISELTELLSLEKTAGANAESALAALTDKLNATRAENLDLVNQLEAEFKRLKKSEETAAGLKGAIDTEKKLSGEALSRVELLNQQIAALRRQMAALNEALGAAEQRDAEAKSRIVDLGRRLNAALAQRVKELARYRSEFFGRLRTILSQRSDIRIVGDRFVFQSEVLFPKGAAQINPEGSKELEKLALALLEVDSQIPTDINWVLRVDGHTDIDPINSARFRSNWELSSARAIAVVKRLIERGVPPEKLVAAGFGEFQPIDPETTPDAKAKNRRIELKLTEK